jgi:glycine/D-amino acid oxidase-like deaminating enzyme
MVNHRPGRHIIGAHVPEHLGDSDRPVAPGEQERHVKDLISVLEARIGVAHGGLEVEATRVCHYTNTRTEDFIVCPHPDDDRITVLSACSGHGFKFTITSGHYAAMTAVGNPVPDAGRFAAHI